MAFYFRLSQPELIRFRIIPDGVTTSQNVSQKFQIPKLSKQFQKKWLHPSVHHHLFSNPSENQLYFKTPIIDHDIFWNPLIVNSC